MLYTTLLINVIISFEFSLTVTGTKKKKSRDIAWMKCQMGHSL